MSVQELLSLSNGSDRILSFCTYESLDKAGEATEEWAVIEVLQPRAWVANDSAPVVD